jgi:phage gp46-like protein
MIRLDYDVNTHRTDLVRDGGNIQTEDLLNSVVMTSLFTRRRALPTDVLPDPADTREGWWADPYADVEGDLIGSRLWLLRRSKATQAVVNQAETYAKEALQWLVDDGVAETVTVEVEAQGEVLAFRVTIEKPSDVSSRWEAVWTAHLAEF